MSREVTIEELKKEKSIYIYGIGKLGKKLCAIFEACEIKIDGIMVSDEKNNPSRYAGISVYAVDNCTAPKDALIIIAVNGAATEEVKKNLSKNGFERYVVWDGDVMSAFWRSYPHFFDDRRKGKDKTLFVLSGYKPYLWEIVFGRLEHFLPEDTEVCICSSGIFDERLARTAENNSWSYLSTEKNSVTLIQNIAYARYKDCTWIYKMDEDIFLTENTLTRMHNAYEREMIKSSYNIGIVAPVIPLNNACYRLVLEKYNCVEDFESKYGKAFIGVNECVVGTPDAALYLWGVCKNIPKIDQIAIDLNEPIVSPCLTKYNIGMIHFRRELWSSMSGFTTSTSLDMGMDE